MGSSLDKSHGLNSGKDMPKKRWGYSVSLNCWREYKKRTWMTSWKHLRVDLNFMATNCHSKIVTYFIIFKMSHVQDKQKSHRKKAFLKAMAIPKKLLKAINMVFNSQCSI